MRLRDRVAIVAGGGQGIGRATARLFVKEGARVVVGDVDTQSGTTTVQEICATGGEGLFVKADVALWKDVQNLMQTTLDTYGAPHILFSSVGIYTRAKLADTEEAIWDRIMAINVKSAYLLCKAVIPHMQAAGGGSIILSSSSVGWQGSAPEIAAYATSKFAITGMTKSAACDYLQDKIRVNCICPGPTDTPMIHNSRTPSQLRAFINGLPAKRLAQPIEVAQAVVFLASDESANITGVALPVDSAQTAWI